MTASVFKNPYEGHKVFGDGDWKCSVKELFERRVIEHPEKVALECEDATYTYTEINRTVNSVAHEILQKLGDGPGGVNIWMEDSFPAVASIMAAWKSGKAVTAIDPSAPIEYNKSILEASLPEMVLLQKKFLPQIERYAPASTRLIIWEDLDFSLNQQNPVNVVPYDRVLEITYTSGSSGRPKGVLISQGADVWHKIMYANSRGNRASDKVLHLSPLSHTNGPSLIMGCFVLGCTISYYPLKKRGIEELPEWISARKITRMSAVPTLFRFLLRDANAKPDLSSVKHLHLGGEQIRPDDVELYKKFFPDDCVLLCNIGSTEAGAFSRYYVTKETEIGMKVPLGRPYPGVNLYIWDENHNEVPHGEPGIIVIESEHLSMGYKDLPELTAEKFLKVPGQPNLQRFITGDLGRWDKNGNLIFLGREDQQIKVNGHRVEMAYIESHLQQHKEILSATMRTWSDEQGGIRLAAYFVPEKGCKPRPKALREWLSQRVPYYMVPRSFTEISELPLTTSHKVDRNSLPCPENNEEDRILPSNETERQVHQMWMQLFQCDHISCKDNFFAIGGNSLLATRLIGDLQTHFEIKLPHNLIFEAPTISALAEKIRIGYKSHGNIVPLAKGEKWPPIFMVHGWAGSIFHFVELARNLKNDQPVFGVQGNEHSGDKPRLTSVEELGRDYARQITETHPDGPLYLLGYSLGGMIALETASQLEAAGRKVTHLFVIDSTPAGLPRSIRSRMILPYLVSRIRTHAGNILMGKRMPDRKYLADRRRALLKILGIGRSYRPTEFKSADEVTRSDKGDYYQVISRGYAGRRINIPTTLLISNQTRSDLRTAWKYVSHNQLSTYTIPGQHLDVLNYENIDAFVRIFREAVNQVNETLDTGKDNGR